MKRLKILVLTAHPPALGVHGGAMRMYYNLKILATRHAVTLISFIEREAERQQLEKVQEMGIEVRAVLRRAEPPNALWMPKPHEHTEYASSEFKRQVHEVLTEHSFDVVQAEFIQMAQHVPGDLQAFKVLTEHEIIYENFHADFRQERQAWTKTRKFYDWLVQLNYEVRACRRFDRIACMTDEDRESLIRFVPRAKVRTVPIGVDSEHFDPAKAGTQTENGAQLLFVGNYRHAPNRDSVHFFASQVLPLIRREVPEAEFYVVGGNVEMLDQQLLQHSPGVEVVGYVSDVRSCYRNATVFVAPILTGTGMRVKLLEAFSMGMPVVATPLAAHGFAGGSEPVLLIGETSERLASQTIRLLKDSELRIALGLRARRMIQEHYDWKSIGRRFLDLVEEGNV